MSPPVIIDIPDHSKLISPSSSSKSIWSWFGFAANASGTILSKQYILCTICSSPILYDRSSYELYRHLQDEHLEIITDMNLIEPKPTKTVKCEDLSSISEDDECLLMEEVENVEYLLADEPMDDENGDEAESDAVDNEFESLEWEDRADETQDHIAGIKLEDKSPVKLDLTKECAKMCISGLMMPEIVEGVGFRAFTNTLRPGQEMPACEQVWEEIKRMYETTHKAEKASLKEKLMFCSNFAIGIDSWTNYEQIKFFSIYVFFESDQDAQIAQIFTSNVGVELDWERLFETLHLETFMFKKCRAAVLNFTPEEKLSSLLEMNAVPVVRCLWSSLEETFKSCHSVYNYELTDFCQRIDDIKEFALKSAPVYDKYWWSYYLYIDRFMKFAKCKEFPPEKKYDFILKLQTVLDVLNPLKIALETIAMEQQPIVSLIQPLVGQLIDNYFSDDNVVIWSQHQVKTMFNELFLSSEYLATVSFLDPRFHNLIEPGKVQSIKSDIRAMCSDHMFESKTAQEEAVQTPAPRPSEASVGLSFFFAKKHKKVPQLRDPFDVEFENYSAIEDVALDQRPGDWWQAHGDDFPRLRHAASRFLCVPAMLPKPKCLLAQQFQFIEDRKQIPETRVIMLWLHSRC